MLLSGILPQPYTNSCEQKAQDNIIGSKPYPGKKAERYYCHCHRTNASFKLKQIPKLSKRFKVEREFMTTHSSRALIIPVLPYNSPFWLEIVAAENM